MTGFTKEEPIKSALIVQEKIVKTLTLRGLHMLIRVSDPVRQALPNRLMNKSEEFDELLSFFKISVAGGLIYQRGNWRRA